MSLTVLGVSAALTSTTAVLVVEDTAGPGSLWSNLPAIITALGALVTAIAALRRDRPSHRARRAERDRLSRAERAELRRLRRDADRGFEDLDDEDREGVL